MKSLTSLSLTESTLQLPKETRKYLALKFAEWVKDYRYGNLRIAMAWAMKAGLGDPLAHAVEDIALSGEDLHGTAYFMAELWAEIMEDARDALEGILTESDRREYRNYYGEMNPEDERGFED